MYHFSTASIKIIQQKWNGITKQRSKAVLKLSIDLERCSSVENESIKVIQEQ